MRLIFEIRYSRFGDSEKDQVRPIRTNQWVSDVAPNSKLFVGYYTYVPRICIISIRSKKHEANVLGDDTRMFS